MHEGLKKVKKLPYPGDNRQLFDTLGVLRGNRDPLKEMDKEFVAVCGKQIGIITMAIGNCETGSEEHQLSTMVTMKWLIIDNIQKRG